MDDPTHEQLLELARQNIDASGDIGTLSRAYLALAAHKEDEDEAKMPPHAAKKNAGDHKKGAHR